MPVQAWLLPVTNSSRFLMSASTTAAQMELRIAISSHLKPSVDVVGDVPALASGSQVMFSSALNARAYLRLYFQYRQLGFKVTSFLRDDEHAAGVEAASASRWLIISQPGMET